jgi:hypothetical protein
MKDFIGQVVENNSSCKDCDLKTRIAGFIITFLLGFILQIMSFGALGGLLLGQAHWFAFLYTAGNITSICS